MTPTSGNALVANLTGPLLGSQDRPDDNESDHERSKSPHPNSKSQSKRTSKKVKAQAKEVLNDLSSNLVQITDRRDKSMESATSAERSGTEDLDGDATGTSLNANHLRMVATQASQKSADQLLVNVSGRIQDQSTVNFEEAKSVSEQRGGKSQSSEKKNVATKPGQNSTTQVSDHVQAAREAGSKKNKVPSKSKSQADAAKPRTETSPPTNAQSQPATRLSRPSETSSGLRLQQTVNRAQPGVNDKVADEWDIENVLPEETKGASSRHKTAGSKVKKPLSHKFKESKQARKEASEPEPKQSQDMPKPRARSARVAAERANAKIHDTAPDPKPDEKSESEEELIDSGSDFEQNQSRREASVKTSGRKASVAPEGQQTSKFQTKASAAVKDRPSGRSLEKTTKDHNGRPEVQITTGEAKPAHKQSKTPLPAQIDQLAFTYESLNKDSAKPGERERRPARDLTSDAKQDAPSEQSELKLKSTGRDNPTQISHQKSRSEGHEIVVEGQALDISGLDEDVSAQLGRARVQEAADVSARTPETSKAKPNNASPKIQQFQHISRTPRDASTKQRDRTTHGQASAKKPSQSTRESKTTFGKHKTTKPMVSDFFAAKIQGMQSQAKTPRKAIDEQENAVLSSAIRTDMAKDARAEKVLLAGDLSNRSLLPKKTEQRTRKGAEFEQSLTDAFSVSPKIDADHAKARFAPTQANYKTPVDASRKQRIIAFDHTGPRNQGVSSVHRLERSRIASPSKTSRTKAKAQEKPPQNQVRDKSPVDDGPDFFPEDGPEATPDRPAAAAISQDSGIAAVSMQDRPARSSQGARVDDTGSPMPLLHVDSGSEERKAHPIHVGRVSLPVMEPPVTQMTSQGIRDNVPASLTELATSLVQVNNSTEEPRARFVQVSNTMPKEKLRYEAALPTVKRKRRALSISSMHSGISTFQPYLNDSSGIIDLQTGKTVVVEKEGPDPFVGNDAESQSSWSQRLKRSAPHDTAESISKKQRVEGPVVPPQDPDQTLVASESNHDSESSRSQGGTDSSSQADKSSSNSESEVEEVMNVQQIPSRQVMKQHHAQIDKLLAETKQRLVMQIESSETAFTDMVDVFERQGKLFVDTFVQRIVKKVDHRMNAVQATRTHLHDSLDRLGARVGTEGEEMMSVYPNIYDSIVHTRKTLAELTNSTVLACGVDVAMEEA